MQDEEKNKRLEIVIAPPRFRHLPDGIYKARLIEINEGLGAYKNEVYEPWFEIIDGPFVLSSVKDMINKKSAAARNSKLCGMIKALDSSVNLEVMTPINLDDFVGKGCFIKTERRGKNIAVVGYYALGEIENAR